MPLDHIGLNVPDLGTALPYYDELFGLFGYVRDWEVGFRPADWNGAQVFLYPALEEGAHSRLTTGLSHLCFHVQTRAEVERAHEWAVGRGHTILHAPREFPEYGAHFATYFLDVHDLMIEAYTHEAAPPADAG